MPATWVSKEKIQTIWGMLHNLRIRMQENIKTPSITATGTGLQASINIALPMSTSSNDYNGFLKVIQTAKNKIKIVDGLEKPIDDEYTDPCWSGMINDFNSTCAATELTIAADAWIYLKAVPSGDPWNSATCSIVQESSEKTYVSEELRHLISRVKFSDGSITSFSQEAGLAHGFILKECE